MVQKFIMENKSIRKTNLASLLDDHLKANKGNSKATFSELISISPSQLSQVMGENSVRNIGDKLARKIEVALSLPGGWLDTLHLSCRESEVEYVGVVKEGFVPVVGEAILGIDGSVDMIEFRSGWLQMYSADKEAYGLKVKGDSMFPRIQSGEFVLIEPNTVIHSGDEVFVRTKDGHNMIKVMTKTRDGGYQFSSVNNEHKPITLEPYQVEKMHYVSAIVKATRYLDHDDINKTA